MAESIRLDKWLWAARFFRSRSLAKQAIEGGKIHFDGARVKVSKEVQVGSVLRIRQGWDERTVKVIGLSDRRGSAGDAALLYEEEPESILNREQRAAERKAGRLSAPQHSKRPGKRDRRLIERFLREAGER